MSIADTDAPVDLDQLEDIINSPGPYPWTFARDVRLLIREARAARERRGDTCRGNMHALRGGYDDRCQCGRVAVRR